MTIQVVAPVAVEQGFVAAVKVQLFDEALEAFGRDLQVRRMVIAGRLGAAKQPVEDLKGRAVLDQLRCGQALDDFDRSIGNVPAQGAENKSPNRSLLDSPCQLDSTAWVRLMRLMTTA